MQPYSAPLEPVDVEVHVDQRQLRVAWSDGHAAVYDFEFLRWQCPCAECRGLRERGLPVWPKPASPLPLRAEDAELVGAWGITFTWNDGHTTGIFSWALLRQWRALDTGADS